MACVRVCVCVRVMCGSVPFGSKVCLFAAHVCELLLSRVTIQRVLSFDRDLVSLLCHHGLYTLVKKLPTCQSILG